MEIKEFVSKYKVLLIIFAIIIVALLQQGGFFELHEVTVGGPYYVGDTIKATVYGTIDAVASYDETTATCDGDTVDIIVDLIDVTANSAIASKVVEGYECTTIAPTTVDLGTVKKSGKYKVRAIYCPSTLYCPEPKEFGSTTFTVSECEDECSYEGQTKCVDSKYYKCGYYDSDPCLEWANLGVIKGKCGVECLKDSDCNANEECIGYKCKVTCSDECSYEGQTKCVDSKYKVCGDYNKDGCLEWSSGKIVVGECGVQCVTSGDCPSGYRCENYKCEEIAPTPECYSDSDCPDIPIENGMKVGKCVSGSCEYSITCNSGYVLKEGRCVRSAECIADSDCPNIPIENGMKVGKCVEGSCSYEIVCDPGYTLENGECVEKAEGNILAVFGGLIGIILGLGAVYFFAKRKIL